jgi:formylglycine-generating enzyme required for sulfatase activity
MDTQFIAIVQKLLAEQGKDAMDNTSRFKSFLANYFSLFSLTGTEYQEECRLLMQAIEAGVAKAISSAQELAICKKQQIKMLQEEHFLAEGAAVDVVDALGLVLRGDTSRTRMSGKAGEGMPATGTLAVTVVTAGTLRISGSGVNQSCTLPAGGLYDGTLNVGKYTVVVAYADGKTETQTVAVSGNSTSTVRFIYEAVLSLAPANMVWIVGGTFTMGSPSSEVSRRGNEMQHQVTISKGFYMGRYVVTQAEYQAVMGSNPSRFKGSNVPVETVSWYDAVEYCNKRSVRESLTSAYRLNGTNVAWDRSANGYRLPTEAEWEYVCRAGTTSPFNTGANITTSQANYDGNFPYNSNAKGTYRRQTTDVGSFAANAWGLYDMHGNVWEWCWDWYGEYANGSQTDPSGADSGAPRVLRGGSWHSSAKSVRSASRSYITPSFRNYYLGFRLVRP